jgi:glutamate racemase
LSDPRPVGVFDSGIGGLSVLRECLRQHPSERFLYVADEAYAPYGPKPVELLQARAEAITRFLLDQDAKAVLVACNTASVSALAFLRARFPVPFVGIVPAVKPAAALTHTGSVGVLATQATTASPALAQLISSFANGSRVLTQDCPDLVTLVEAGRLEGADVERAVNEEVGPLLTEGIDVLVLGCTHLPFLSGAIEKVCGPGVHLLDPASAVARQLGRVLAERGLANTGPTDPPRYFTTGDPVVFEARLKQLFGVSRPEVLRATL